MEAEGHGARAYGFDPQPAVAPWRYDPRTATAQFRVSSASQDAVGCAAQRTVGESDIAGNFHSCKLDRTVHYESRLEFDVLIALERSEQIAYYQEQPAKISYVFQGRNGEYPRLYEAPKKSLYDVTSGQNGTCSKAYLCTAKPGYDGPTGMGSPNGMGAF